MCSFVAGTLPPTVPCWVGSINLFRAFALLGGAERLLSSESQVLHSRPFFRDVCDGCPLRRPLCSRRRSLFTFVTQRASPHGPPGAEEKRQALVSFPLAK